MRYLLDTHVVIWYFEDSSELPKKITELIDNPEISPFSLSIKNKAHCFREFLNSNLKG